MSLVLISLTLLTAAMALPQLGGGTPTLAELANTSVAIAAAKTNKVKVKSGKKKIAKGSLAAVIVCVVIAVIVLSIIAFLLYKRQQKKKAQLGEKGVVGHVDGPGPETGVGHQTGDVGVHQRQDGRAAV